jgi:[acyl-carrier-protein] S-malonyltransferase
MRNFTLLFPGQGSQYVGMGEKIKNRPSFQYFSKASEILGYSLTDLCLHGPKEQLKLTEFTQPAIFTHSVALLEEFKTYLREQKIVCPISLTLGHSIGEYSALFSAGALSFEDAVRSVSKRGMAMQSSVPIGLGSMYAVLRASNADVLKACQAVSTRECVVVPANFNEPTQTVISGHSQACEMAIQWMNDNLESKARFVKLEVSAPFHSPLMIEAENTMRDYLSKIDIHHNNIPYIANVDGKLYGIGTEPEVLRDNLIKQICGQVLWVNALRLLSPETICVEVGPGGVLKGLLKKTRPEIECISLDSEQAFDELTRVMAKNG